MAKIKIEEEKSEEKFLKKEKKLKNGKAPLQKNGTVNNGGLTERTKAKKSKKTDAVCSDFEEESCNVKTKRKKIKKQPEFLSDEKSHVMTEKDKEDCKKIKKKTTFTECLNDTSGSNIESENGTEVKKKKKKKKQLAEDREEIPQTVIMEKDGSKKERKEKKIKKSSLQVQSEKLKLEKEGEEEDQQARKDELPKKAEERKNNVLVLSTEEPGEQIIQKKKKKKKKTSTSEESSDTVDEKTKTKKSKKVNRNICENQTKSDTPKGETGEVEKLKHKKKRAKNLLEKGANQQENDGGSLEIQDNTFKKKKSKIAIVDEGETVLNTERKKKAKRASAEVTEVEEKEPAKKKKKRKMQQQEEEEPPLVKCEQVEEQIDGSLVKVVKEKRQKRKVTSVNSENMSSDTGTKKKKKKMIKDEGEEQNLSTEADLLLLSVKYGNTDEVTINQERRKALQIEVDQASQPEKTAKPTGFGQWGTAQFDTSEQQQKFLRLMGGFKKGFQPAAGNTTKANMALGKNAQQQLQQGLQGEFERAHTRRMDNNRGAGLGFTSPSNKKFFIDVNASRSIRFDD